MKKFLIVTVLASASFLHLITADDECNFGIDRLTKIESGVPINFQHNESATVDENHSAPGCPKAECGHPWVYFGNPPKCFLSGRYSGPCGPGFATLSVQFGSPYGFCYCNCLYGQEADSSNAQFCDSYVLEGWENVFIPKLRACYGLHLQGPCGKGEWLVKTRNTEGVLTTCCERRRCTLGSVPDQSRPEMCIPLKPRPGGGSAVFDVNRTKCPSNATHSDYKYSKLLKRCVPRFVHFL